MLLIRFKNLDGFENGMITIMIKIMDLLKASERGLGPVW